MHRRFLAQLSAGVGVGAGRQTLRVKRTCKNWQGTTSIFFLVVRCVYTTLTVSVFHIPRRPMWTTARSRLFSSKVFICLNLALRLSPPALEARTSVIELEVL